MYGDTLGPKLVRAKTGPGLRIDAAPASAKSALDGERTRGDPIIDETEYRSFFRKVPRLHAILDRDGRIEDISDNLRNLAGLSMERSAGMPVWNMPFWTEEGRGWLREAISAASAGTPAHAKLGIDGAGSGIEGLDLSLGPIRSDSGSVSKLWLEAAQWPPEGPEAPAPDNLGDSGAIEEFARLAAHDFNNLLAGIGGNLELVARRKELDETSRRRIGRALRGVFRGRALTELMGSFGADDRAVQSVDIRPVVAAAVERCRDGLDPALAVTVDLPEGLWLCRADPDRLAAALLLLMIDAHDGLGKGDSTRVQAENRALGAKVQNTTPFLAAGDYVALTIMQCEAANPSIHPEPVSFSGSDGLGQHLGLGQQSVLDFARRSGGDLWLADGPGRGAAARLYLPRADAPTEF